MDIDLLNNHAGNNTENNTKRRKKKRKKKALKNGPQNMDQMKAPQEVKDCEVANNGSEKNLETDIIVTSLAEHPKMDAESTKNLSFEVNTDRKKKKKQKKKKKAKVKDDIQSTEQTKIDTGLTENIAEGNVTVKRKRRKKRKRKVKDKDEIQNMEQANDMLNLHLSDENHGQVIDGNLTENECIAQISELSVRKEAPLSNLHDKENALGSCKNEETVLLSDMVEVPSIGVSSELVEERSGTSARPMELEGEFFPSEIRHSPHSKQTVGKNFKFENGLSGINSEMVVNQGNCSAEGSLAFSTCIDEVTTHLSSSVVKEAACESCPRIAPVVSIKRKLLVLDVNGLLAYIVMPAPKECRGDTHILGRAIFKRPFCDDFLKFCFQNFDVGIWSSRSKRIIEKVVDYLLGELRDKLLFCWDMEHSTQTGFKTLENSHKPLVCKELGKIWENDNPDFPWKKGDYDESNTLLLDDSPYKALLNPLHTAIFPNSYHYENKNDNSLGPGGDLRVYLEGLLASENVQKYVEQHPFGQSAINETNLSWGFYSGVLQTLSNRVADNTPTSPPTLDIKTSTCQ
ncbi:hypothetical protein BUALT_Bualt04G0135000 [Buddleja alternifolia]|uniref:Mitochondrial import inner membrane translocase subunit TIM50 n=1 Tax=Buddleja alternifolia TaxID=168488 RepID=A0AAV6XQ29_9LAMI|nr:hypothetical protein BUALT_Bualt04G0135000 [Buddleja alternifolia]